MKNRLKHIFLPNTQNGAGRRKFFAKYRARRAMLHTLQKTPPWFEPGCAEAVLQPKGFDPELLFVECSRCGAPSLWEKGRATKLLDRAGIDPLELDASCMLITDACPSCSGQKEYTVKIFRVSSGMEEDFPLKLGHA